MIHHHPPYPISQPTHLLVVSQGPRCSIRSKNMYSDLAIDYSKMLALNLPGVLLVRCG